jgi:CheY-specific phosphatase CheX
MENNEKNGVEGILQEYKEEIQNLLRGEKTNSFDEITSKAIEKMKNKLKDAAEETTE